MKYFIVFVLLMFSYSGFSQDKVDLLIRSERILAQGDTSRALAAFSEILRIYPQSFAAALRLAEINYAKGDLYQAIQYCNIGLDITENYIASKERSLNILGLAPDSSRQIRQFVTDQAYMHHLKGNIRVQQNRPLDAEHEFRRSLALNPEASKVMLDLAILLADQERFDDTKTLLKSAIEKDSMNIAGRLNLASLYNGLGQQDSAKFYYNEVIRLSPKNKWPYLQLGNIYAENHKHKAAISQYTNYISLDTTSAEVYYRRAISYTELMQYDSALSDWTSSLNLVQSADAYRNRGLTYFQLDKYEEAIADFNGALELEPVQPYTQINRGYCYYLLGKPKTAIEDIEAGLKIVPNYNLGYYFKALTYYQLRKKKKYCEALNKAMDLGLKDVDIDPKLLKKCF